MSKFGFRAIRLSTAQVVLPSLMTSVFIAIAAAAIAFPTTTEARITVTGVERASNVEIADVNGTVTIYGGMAGSPDRCDILSTSQTCNNCLLKAGETVPAAPDTYLFACNERRINPNLQLIINIVSDAADGIPVITNDDGSTAIPLISSTTTVVPKGTTTSIVVAWSSICTRIVADDPAGTGGLSGAGPCLTVNEQGAATFRVGISSAGTTLNKATDDQRSVNIVLRNGVGNPAQTTTSLAEKCADAGTDPEICYFEVGPGDEKAVVKTLRAPDNSGFPSTTTTQVKYVRFLFAETGFDHIHLGSNHVDLPVSATDTSNFNVSPRRIEGLENDKKYYFKNALVDPAGNVSMYSSSAMDVDCSNSPDPSATDCRTVTPSQVVGVLDKSNCFIATAAYGTTFTSELDTLRDFRDQILENSVAGHSFVRWYYANSPKYAKMLLEHPLARATVRAGLVPIVWFAGMALAYGPFKASLAFLVSLIAIAALINLGRRPEVRNAARDNYMKVKDRARRSLLPLLIGALLLPALPLHRAEAATSSARRPQAAQRQVPSSRSTASTASMKVADVEPLEESIEQALDETPPPPEYPYPGASGTVPPTPIVSNAKKPNSKPAIPAPAPTPSILDNEPSMSDITAENPSSDRPAAEVPPANELTASPDPMSVPTEENIVTRPPPRRKRIKPIAITDEGEYIYEKLPDTPPKKYGPPKPKKFSNLRGREKPMTITADGEFTYPVEHSPFSGAAGIRFGMMSAPNITNKSNGLTFKDIYGAGQVPAVLIEYEYPLTRAIGRIGIKFETGVYTTQAAGRFKNPQRATEIPEERFTFLMIPLQATVHYRFQFADSQLIVPFMEGGAAYYGIAELRDDNKRPQVGGAPALVAGGGVNILLDWLDRRAVNQLDADYGINHVWFTAQYRQIVGLKKEVDVSSNMISGGFTFDF